MTKPKLRPAAQASDCTCPKRWNGHTHQCWLRVVKRLAVVVADNCALKDELAATKRPTKARKAAK